MSKGIAHDNSRAVWGVLGKFGLRSRSTNRRATEDQTSSRKLRSGDIVGGVPMGYLNELTAGVAPRLQAAYACARLTCRSSPAQ